MFAAPQRGDSERARQHGVLPFDDQVDLQAEFFLDIFVIPTKSNHFRILKYHDGRKGESGIVALGAQLIHSVSLALSERTIEMSYMGRWDNFRTFMAA